MNEFLILTCLWPQPPQVGEVKGLVARSSVHGEPRRCTVRQMLSSWFVYNCRWRSPPPDCHFRGRGNHAAPESEGMGGKRGARSGARARPSRFAVDGARSKGYLPKLEGPFQSAVYRVRQRMASQEMERN